MNIETLAIGDEILTGTIADTNSQFVGAELMLLGHRLSNSVGMAPGFFVKIESCQCFFLPGVPLEMKAIFHEHVKPLLQTAVSKGGGQLRTRLWKCIGIFESQLQVVMNPIESKLGEVAILGYRTHFPENHLTLYYRGHNTAEFETLIGQIDQALQPWCYSHRESLEEIVLRELERRGNNLALAESCTAGLVSHRLSTIPGASKVLQSALCVYQVDAKRRLLGIDLKDPNEAVSEKCTIQMAHRIKEWAGTEFAASITGYMGPECGSDGTPAGTVYCCVINAQNKLFNRKLLLNAKDRERCQWGAATHLLDVLRCSLL